MIRMWEYSFMVIEEGESLTGIIADLNKLGGQGWEVAAACQHPDPDNPERHQRVLFLKRCMTEAGEPNNC